MQATLEFCQERADAAAAEDMASCLANLPSRGLLTDPSCAAGPSGRLYLCLHNTKPPGGKLLKNAPCSLADLYRTHHAKLQQQERPPLKRKAQNQLPDLRPPPLPPAAGGQLATHQKLQQQQQQQQQGGGLLNPAPAAAGTKGRLIPMGQPKPSVPLQQQQRVGTVGAAGSSLRLAPSSVTRAPHTTSPSATPGSNLTPGTRCPLNSSSTPTSHRQQPGQQQQQQRHGAPQQQQQGATGGTPTPTTDHRHMHYTLEQLNGMVLKELGGLCGGRGLPSSGRKADLVRRLMEYQRRLQRASRPS